MLRTSGPLRIAVFTETFLPKIDGVVSILCLMLKWLNELGHTVVLFGPAGGPSEYEGARIVGIGGPRLPYYPELQANIPGPRIWEEVQHFQPDLIHLVNPVLLGLPVLGYAKRLGVPCLASFHTDLARYATHYGLGFLETTIWHYLRSIHNCAHLNLCTSTFMRDDLRSRGFQRMRWWRRGIDTELFSPGARNLAMRARLTAGHPNEFLIVNVGRHSPEKGLKEIREHIFPTQGVRLAFIGGGPSHNALKEHYRHTATVFPGYLRGVELVNAYRCADAFIFPSTTETFGLVALEAMACGVPVIAAKAGGVVDTVIDGVNGYLYDPAQLEQIGPLVQRLRQEPVLHANLAQSAIAHAQSRNWRTTMDQLVDYYYTAIRLFKISTQIWIRN